ncbi:MAG TPA: ATP-binding protein [Cytophagaceae bacterium]|nr:ATP-binding protein [Cytophagaceae bacterium]
MVEQGIEGIGEKDSARAMDIHSWIYILSNLAIGLAFLGLGIAMYYLISKRKDLSLRALFWLYIILLGFFGITFLLDGFIHWFSTYQFASYVKLVSVIIIWGLFLFFLQMLPKIFQMRSQNQLKVTIEEKNSALHKTYEKLEESDRQLKILINHHPDCISQLDKNLNYIFVNKTILDLTGMPEDFYVGRSVYNIGLSERFVREQVYYARKTFEEGIEHTFDTMSESPKIGARKFRVSFIPVWDKEGKMVESVLNVSQDITNQRKFEDDLNDTIHELQELSGNLANKNRQLQDFAHIVSHNLRSPMSNLVALMHLYENERSTDQKDFLVKKIGEVTRSFSKTIDDLTEVVKIRQTVSLEFQEHIFEEVVHDIKTMLNTQIESSNTLIHCDFSQCTNIRYPKVYLESILLNLITNAIKYRSEKQAPEIRLTTKMIDGSVLLVCEDNGLGIDLKKFGDKIFGMNKTFHPNADSRGMGLFITRNQLESLGGSISVESEPGKGSAFTVLFG